MAENTNVGPVEGSIKQKDGSVAEGLRRISKKLLDLSLRNRLLNYRESTRTVRVIDELPNFVFNNLVEEQRSMECSPNEELEEGNTNGKQRDFSSVIRPVKGNGVHNPLDKELPFPPPDLQNAESKHIDSYLQTPHSKELLERKLKRLVSESKLAIEETGANILFLAMGFLEWQEKKDAQKSFTSPLVLVPIRIQRKKKKLRAKSTIVYPVVYTEEELEYNQCLAQKLKEDFDVILPGLSYEDATVNVEDYFAKVEACIVGMPNWRVRREMVIDFFSFAKLFMYLDLQPENWPKDATITSHSIISDLILGRDRSDEAPFGEEIEIDGNKDVRDIPLILRADSAQHSVIAESLAGKNLIVEGPPGTGKSQTISNLIAAFLAQGKSVLFLAEKLAALNVVKRRLDSAGLGDFVLELHSHKSQRKVIHSALDRRMNRRFTTPNQLEEKLDQLNAVRSELSDYLTNLHTVFTKSGKTPFDVFWDLDELRSRVGILEGFALESPSELSNLDIENRQECLGELLKTCFWDSPKASPWFGIGVPHLYPTEVKAYVQRLDKFRALLQKVIAELDDLSSTTNSHLDFTFLQLSRFNLEDFKILDERPEPFLARACHAAIFEADRNKLEVFVEKANLVEHHSKFLSQWKIDPRTFDQSGLAVDMDKIKGLALIAGGALTLGELHKFAEVAISLLLAVRQLRELLEGRETLECYRVNSFDDADQLEAFFTLVVEAAPSSACEDLCLFHFRDGVSDVFTKAQKRHAQIQEFERVISEQFDLAAIPSKSEVERYLSTFSEFASRPISKVFSSKFRQAKRAVKVFSKEKLSLEGAIDNLSDLIKFLSDCDEFKSNHEYSKWLGSCFDGYKTDWQRLSEIIEWVRSLRACRVSPKVIDEIKEDFDLYLNQNGSFLDSALLTLREVVQHAQSLREFEQFTLQGSLTLGQGEELLSNVTQPYTDLKVFLTSLSATSSESLDTVVNIANSIGLVHGSEGWISSEESFLRGVLECDRNDFASRIPTLLSNLQWMDNLQDSPLTESQLSWLYSADIRFQAEHAFKKICSVSAARQELLSSIQEDLHDTQINHLKNTTLTKSEFLLREILERLDFALDHRDEISGWSSYCGVVRKAGNYGLNEIVSCFENGNLPREAVLDHFNFALVSSLIEVIAQRFPSLQGLTRARIEELRAKFKQLDEEIESLNSKLVAHRASRKLVPSGVSTGRVAEYTEKGLLQHEFRKTKRHIPVRQLLRRAPGAFKALTPCFMMSPLSVAQYLAPGVFEFDVVIMDEASQLRAEDCLGALARAHQVIVVGDSNQLPPTSFFDRLSEEDDEEEEETSFDGMESILDICGSTYENKRRLTWHYRSLHHDLIRFSNHNFYEDSLVLFPSPLAQSQNLGIFHHLIENGTFSGGKNEVEAMEVARAAIKQMIQFPDLTLGIGTFNRRQCDLIVECIEKLLIEEFPEADDVVDRFRNLTVEPFFVKNLENIQGDERDVIFISCTYGPDPVTKKVYQRFGPINSDKGWRRLNVMFTRAKKQMHIFTSMKPDDIAYDPGQSGRGTQVLRQFLEYSQSGMLGGVGTPSGKGPDSPFEVAVSRVIQQLGFSVDCQVGASGYFVDLAVIHPNDPGEYILAVECDGATYHSAKSARDRDRLRQEVLEAMGWRVHRIWSTDWFMNREREVARLEETIREQLTSSKVVTIAKEQPNDMH